MFDILALCVCGCVCARVSFSFSVKNMILIAAHNLFCLRIFHELQFAQVFSVLFSLFFLFVFASTIFAIAWNGTSERVVRWNKVVRVGGSGCGYGGAFATIAANLYTDSCLRVAVQSNEMEGFFFVCDVVSVWTIIIMRERNWIRNTRVSCQYPSTPTTSAVGRY